MEKRASTTIFLGLMLLLLALVSAVASPPQVAVARFDARGGIPGPPPRGDTTPPTVLISSPSDGDVVSGIIIISADVMDDVAVGVVEYGVDGAGWTSMSSVGGSIYAADWNSASVYDGGHTITVRAMDTSDNEGTDSITVTTSNEIAPPPYQYELWIEIDYIAGHEPTQTVLDYIKWYYLGNNPTGDLISVTFYVENVTQKVNELGINYANGINDNEFWAIEKAVNDLGDDKYGAGDPVFGTAGVYSSKWKWILYGTTVEGAPYVIGYTYVIMARIGRTYDLLAGNYIFIADEAADSWASSQEPPIEPYGADGVVLMHEMGHSIGIAVLSRRGAEVYDPDTYSVMSYLSTANAGLYEEWYYSDEYWATRNMDYYTV